MEENYYKCCFTGYRPQKFPFKLKRGDEGFEQFENALFEQVLKLAEENCRVFYCGMAMGFDMIAAETVLAVKNAFSEPLKLICVLPFEAQGDSFSGGWKERFYCVLERADEIKILSKDYFSGCYQKRNKFMVDNSDYVITWYDGKKGGTRNTIDYALKRGRQVFNIYENSVDDLGYQTEFELL